jgi:hypothetical protein
MLSLLSVALYLSTVMSQALTPIATIQVPATTKAEVQAIDAGQGRMRKEEGKRPSEALLVAFYEGSTLRKLELPEFDAAYYFSKGDVMYAREKGADATTEAVFERGHIIATLRNGRLLPNDERHWLDPISDAQRVLEEEKAFSVKPLAEKGAEVDKVEAARAELDGLAAAIDRMQGTTVEKSVWGLSNEGATLTGLSVSGELRRISMRMFNETNQGSTTFYLRDARPFLVVRTTYGYTMPFDELRSRVGGARIEKSYLIHSDGGMNTDEEDKHVPKAYLDILARPEKDVTVKEDKQGAWSIMPRS